MKIKLQLRSYLVYLSTLKDAFESVRQTTALENQNVNIIYALDFSEIFKFCFPFDESFGIVSLPYENPGSIVLRERIALWNLFNLQNKLILLPPHRVELINKLRYEIDNIIPSFNVKKENFDALKKDILISNNFKELKKLIDKHNKKENLTSEETASLIKYIQDDYLLIKTIELISGAESVEKLRRIFSNKIVEYFEDIFRNFYIDEIELAKRTVPWFDQFLIEFSYEGKNDKKVENEKFIDALSCVYLEEVNKINDFKERTIVLFVSRSRKMLSILDNLFKIKLNNLEFTISRNLESITLLRLKRIWEETGKKQLWDNLMKNFLELEKVYPLLNRYQNSNSEDISYKDKELIYLALGNIDKIHNLLHSKENLKLFFLNKSRIYDKDLSYFEDTSVKTVLKNLSNIIYSDESLLQHIIDKFNLTNNSLVELSQHLLTNLEIINKKNKISFTQIQKKIKTDNTFILGGISGELPIQLNIYNSHIRALSRKYLLHKEKQSINTYDDLINKLLELKKKDSDIEIDLVIAFSEACAGNLEQASYIIDTALESSTNEQTFELTYFKCFLCRKRELTLEGIKTSYYLDSNKQKDPRLLRETGVLIWQATFLQSDSTDYKEICKILHLVPSKQLAQDIFLQALQNTKEDNLILKMSCYNSIAYILAESENLEDIKFAQKHFLEVEKIFKTSQFDDNEYWISRFYDTRAFINYKYTIHNNELTKETKKQNLEEALKDFDKAFSLKGLIGNEFNIVTKHKFETYQVLQDLSQN